MKYLLFLTPLFLGGCKTAEWLVENEEAIKASSETAESVGGPIGYIISAAAGLTVAGAKWYQDKSKTKELIEAVQKAKNELPPESKKLLKDQLNVHMPSKVKKMVKSIKGKLK